MRILFVLQGSDFWNPLGLMHIAAIAKKRGDETDVAIFPEEDIFSKIGCFKPDMIAYGSSSHEHKEYLKINRIVKSKYPKIFTIMGGSHPTFFQDVLDNGNLDAICVGEGESPFLELLNKLDKKEDISCMKNIVVKGGKLNGLYPLIQDLDSIPFPDRELFYKASIAKKEKIPAMNFMASRGCPYNCTYCFNHAFRQMYPGQKYLRRRSVENVLGEIEETKNKFNLKFVKFVDDIFVTKNNLEWLKEFCSKYPERIGLPFLIYTRFDMINEDVVKMLKTAGCSAFFMSIESANPNIREKVLNRKMDSKTIIQAARWCNKHKISILAYTMLGLPESTIKDDIEAVNFSINAGIDVAEFPIFQPLIKTELSSICIQKGLVDEKTIKNYDGGFNQSSILNSFSSKEKNIQKNLSSLGPIAVRHPLLRAVILRFLIFQPNNSIFTLVYAIDKMFTYSAKIYKTKYTLKERLRLIRKTLKLEKNRWKVK